MLGALKRLLQMAFLQLQEEPGRAEALEDSLLSARLTELEWSGRPSRSGATFYVQRLRASLRTGKHEHELSCWTSHSGVLYCDWEVDGKRVGTIELDPNDPVYTQIGDAIEFALTTEKVEENKLEMRERPIVMFYNPRVP